MLFDGGEALCYLDCCSICIMTIIMCMYLISVVISFICVTGIFSRSLVIYHIKREKQLLPSMVAKTHAWIVTCRNKETANYEVKSSKINGGLTVHLLHCVSL